MLCPCTISTVAMLNSGKTVLACCPICLYTCANHSCKTFVYAQNKPSNVRVEGELKEHTPCKIQNSQPSTFILSVSCLKTCASTIILVLHHQTSAQCTGDTHHYSYTIVLILLAFGRNGPGEGVPSTLSWVCSFLQQVLHSLSIFINTCKVQRCFLQHTRQETSTILEIFIKPSFIPVGHVQRVWPAGLRLLYILCVFLLVGLCITTYHVVYWQPYMNSESVCHSSRSLQPHSQASQQQNRFGETYWKQP